MQQIPKHLAEWLAEGYAISRAQNPRIEAYRQYGLSGKFVSFLLGDVESGELVITGLTAVWMIFTYTGTPLFNTFTTYTALMAEVTPFALMGAWATVLAIQLYALVTGNPGWRASASTIVMYLYGLLAVVLVLDIGRSILAAVMGLIGFGGWYSATRLQLRAQLHKPAKRRAEAIHESR